MNCNDYTYSNYRGRNRNFRGRGARAVNVQRPLIGQSRRSSNRTGVSTDYGSHTSTIKWKNHSSTSNNLTTTIIKSSSSKTTTFDADSSRIVIAVSAGRGEATYEVGIAALDVCKPTLILCQISDMPSYINTLTKINILNPDEILIPMTFVELSNSSRLVTKIKQHFRNTIITATPRATYNKQAGMQFIKEFCAPQWDSIFLILQHKYYCLTAASALFSYTESALFVIYNKQSLKVEYQESEGYCTIDVSTADKLELVAPNTVSSNERYASLYGILNYCLTKIGARTLRATILQPPCSVPDIEARLDCVTELKKNSNMMMAVQTILPKISNIDQLLSLATLPSDQGDNFTERHLMYVLTLNALLNLLEPLKEIFEESQQPFFKEIRTTLENETFNELTHIVKTIIQPDAHPAKGQQGIIEKCFLIKPGVNGLLDVLRKTYSERVEDLREYVNQLRDKYNLPLTLNNNSRKGYHISLQLNAYTKKSFKKSELPNEFIQVERLYSSVTMMTTDLVNLASRIDDILLEILKMSSVMVYQILIKVRDHIGLMYKLCEDIAKLDMIQSLAQASSGIGYTRPEFGDYLEITNSRHPLLDFLCSTEPTSNSIFATPDHNVHIITGPNGSGKSIYIRQVLLLQVMAQVGCFIPAEVATLRVCDRILARVYFDDNMDCGASSFILEIKEIQYFHTVMTANTLIIIDELCRSTAVDEGTYLAMAIIESLAKNQAFIFVATHYTFVTNLEEFYPNLTNWQMETNETRNERTILQFTFSVIPGITSFKKYGLVAAFPSWPRETVKQAEQLYDQIEIPKEHTTIQGLDVLTRLKYNFEAELKMLKAKKKLTASILEEKSYIYQQNLNTNGLDITHFLPRNLFAVYPESNLQDGQNLTYQVMESEQALENNMDLPMIYPEVVYSPSIANSAIIHDNHPLEDYDQFCREIEILQHQNDSIMLPITSQNLRTTISEKEQQIFQNGINFEGTDDRMMFTQTSTDLQNPQNNLDQHQIDFDSVPWKSNSFSNSDFNTQECSDIDNRDNAEESNIDWRSLNDSVQNQDVEISAAIEELNECSNYFTQEWDEIDGVLLKNSEASVVSNVTKVSPKVIIHSVHVINKENKITAVQKFDPDQGKLVEVNNFKSIETENLSGQIPSLSSENFQTKLDVDKGECITSFSGQHSGTISNNNASFNVINSDAHNPVYNPDVKDMTENVQILKPSRKTYLTNEFVKLELQDKLTEMQISKLSSQSKESFSNFETISDINLEGDYLFSSKPTEEIISNTQDDQFRLSPPNSESNFDLNVDNGNSNKIDINNSQSLANLKESKMYFSQKNSSNSLSTSWFSIDPVNQSQSKLNVIGEISKGKSGKHSFANTFYEILAKKDALRSAQNTQIIEESNQNDSRKHNSSFCNIIRHDTATETPQNNQLKKVMVSSQKSENRLRSQSSTVKLYSMEKNSQQISTNPKETSNEDGNDQIRSDSEAILNKNEDGTENQNNTIDSNATTVLLNHSYLNNLHKTNEKIEDKSNKFTELSFPKYLNLYFDGNSSKIESQNHHLEQLNKTQSTQSKSQIKSIFENSGSESIFSTPEEFYSAGENSPKSKPQLQSKKRTCRSKFVPPLKKANISEHQNPKQIANKSKTLIKKTRTTKFVPPKILTKKEILEDFENQKRQLLENTDDPDHVKKFVDLITNRPNTQQIQSQQCLAKITKIGDGLIVTPASEQPIVKRRKTIPLRKKLSSADFDKTLFSDRNENKYKCVLKSEEKNTFNFDSCNGEQIVLGSGQEMSSQLSIKGPLFSDSGFSAAANSEALNSNIIDDLIKKYLDSS